MYYVLVNPWILGGVLNHPISRIVGINKAWWSPMIKDYELLLKAAWFIPTYLWHVAAQALDHGVVHVLNCLRPLMVTRNGWRFRWPATWLIMLIVGPGTHDLINKWFVTFKTMINTMIIDLPLSNWSWLIRCLVSTRLANNFKSLMNWWRQHQASQLISALGFSTCLPWEGHQILLLFKPEPWYRFISRYTCDPPCGAQNLRCTWCSAAHQR